MALQQAHPLTGAPAPNNLLRGPDATNAPTKETSVSHPFSLKRNMLRRLREIAQTLDVDLSWIDPVRRRGFVVALAAERDEALDIVMAEAPAPDDVYDARQVLIQLRRGSPEFRDAAKAAKLEDWLNQTGTRRRRSRKK